MNSASTNTKVITSLLWIAVLFNMIFADIFSIIIELKQGNIMDIPMEPTLAMGIAAVLTNIPIFMVFLSWVLPYSINRKVNIVAASFTILYVIGGGVALPHYFIMGGIEVLLLIALIVLNYRWKVHL